MKTSDLIVFLIDSLEENGDMPIIGSVMGKLYDHFSINRTDGDESLCIELIN